MNSQTILSGAYRKIDLRILPLLVACYAFAVLDRTNIAFAKLQMQSAIHLTESQYGLAAGIFFIGYVLFEIPSNLLLPKVGAKRTLARILVLWGLTSAATLFVRDAQMFYVMRFMLGVFEAGFAPGVIFFLTYWYPEARMGRAMALFMCASPIASIAGGPLSGWLLTSFSGTAGLAGWQWMFLVEGIPSVLLGLLVIFALSDRPSKASWLTPEEKDLLAADIQTRDPAHGSFRQVMRNPNVHIMAAAYFCIVSGMYFVFFWLPTLLRAVPGLSISAAGWYSTIPYIVSAIGMIWIAQRSDRKHERRWHSAVPAFVAAAAVIAASYCLGKLGASLITMTIAEAAMFCSYTVFWATPSMYLKGDSAAGGIAYINSVGLIGGFLSPTVVGMMKEASGTLSGAMIVMCGLLVLGGALMLYNRPRVKHRIEDASIERTDAASV